MGNGRTKVDSGQLGNGFRGLSRKRLMSRRIIFRRSKSVSTSRSRPSRSPSYHSSGMSAVHRQTASQLISSALVSAGSNDSQLVTPSYTQLFANTPRRGKSGNVHSPALKQ